MDEFVLLFRLDIINKEAQPSPEQMQVYMKQYHRRLYHYKGGGL
jgi:hypothetical protein